MNSAVQSAGIAAHGIGQDAWLEGLFNRCDDCGQWDNDGVCGRCWIMKEFMR